MAADDEQPPESWAEWVRPATAVPPVGPALSAAEPPPAADTPAAFLDPLPPLSCPHCPDRPGFLQARQQAGFYRSLFHACKRREAALNARIAELEADNRRLKQRLFGARSESRQTPDRLAGSPQCDPLAEDASPSADAPSATDTTTPARPRRRGQQPDRPIPARRDYSHLPVVTEERVLAPQQSCCACCGLPLAPAGFEEDSTLIEIEVRAYRRRIRRRRYRRTCSCPDQPRIVAAPVAPRVLPHSQFGVSVWVQILLDKYAYCRPTAKQLDDLCSHGLDLSAGTLIGDLKRLAGLFEPVNQKLLERSRAQALWNADETRWPVFQVVAGKVGHCWYVWLFDSKDCAVFTLDKGRAHDVPETHFGTSAAGIVMVDRYSAYKAMKPVKEGRLRLAFCWAHQRRDFLDVEKSWPKHSDWAAGWVARIGQLYRRNAERLAARAQGQDAQEADQPLREAVAAMRQQWEAELADEQLHPAKRKVLQSMKGHWEGLTLFVTQPHVPLDNNQAERTLRVAALGRKNYYGSGAEWSGKLASGMFSILATLEKWGINPRKWLTAYLHACAEAKGKAPGDVERWLPWNLSAQQRKALAEKEEASADTKQEPE
jgi:transposase